MGAQSAHGRNEPVLLRPERLHRNRPVGPLAGEVLPGVRRRTAPLGEKPAVATLERLRDKFGEAIAAVINILDPGAIVIGGGVGNIDLLYSDETRRAIGRFLFNPTLATRILRPQLGDSAGVFGAAMLTMSP